jgi:alpha-N-arabinofuranosidase
MDEWNYWHRPYEYGELGCIYRLRDALGIAAGLHEYYRCSDIIAMAHYAQTVNVIGCIKTTKTAAAFATTGLPLQLYRRHFGVVPLTVTTAGPLDVTAALTEDGRQVTIGIVNPSDEGAIIDLQLDGGELAGQGQGWQIAGDDPMAFNEPGVEPQVTIQERPVRGAPDGLDVAPCSVTVFSLNLK